MIRNAVEAWSKQNSNPVLKKKPDFVTLMKNRKALLAALHDVGFWHVASWGSNQKSVYENVKFLVSLFGYEPYTGEAYRVIPTDHLKVPPTVGEVRKINPGKANISSWTTDPSRAVNFAKRNPSKVSKRYAVLRLIDGGQQVMNARYLEAIVEYLASIFTKKLAKDTWDITEQGMKDMGLDFMGPLWKKDDGLWKVLFDMEFRISATKGYLYKYSGEDEILMLLPKPVNVEFVVVKT